MKASAFGRVIEARRGMVKAARGILRVCAAAILFVGADTLAAEAGAGSAPVLAASPPANAATNAPSATSAENSIKFNFRNAPLETVLNYLSRTAGYVIHPEVSLNGRVDAWSDQPLSPEEAVALLEHVLSDQGYAVVRDGRLLTIYSASDTRRRNVPVIRFTRIEDIPRNAEVATYIIPVRTLNPVALVNNLRPLINPSADLQANESANSLLITDSQNDIRRIAQIIMQLDSVSSSINTVEVFPLKYADAKSLSDLVKQLFPSQDAASSTPQIGGFFGGGGLGGLFGQTGAANGSSNGRGTRITSVSDDHSNSLIVSAPEDMLPTIRQLVQRLDQPTEDVTEVRVFQLKNADPTETANTLATLFPSVSSSDATQSPFQFAAFGGLGGFPGAPVQSTGASQYVKRMADVLAVPDPRTRALVVSASKDMMPQIEGMITELDSIDHGKLNVHRIALNNAEPADLMQIIQDIYPSGSTTTRQNNTQNNALMQRAQTVGQNQLTSGPGSGSSSSSSRSGSGSGSTVSTGF